MGDKQSKHKHHEEHHEEPPAESERKSDSKSPAVTNAAEPELGNPPETVEVLISSTSSSADLELASLIKDGLENLSVSAYIHSKVSEQAAKLAGKMVVDAKCIVYLASKDAAKNNVGQDLLSLAYISNKPILVAAKGDKIVLLKEFVVGMKMTLQQIPWTIFDEESQQDEKIKMFIEEARSQCKKVEDEVTSSAASDSSAFIKRRGGRLNTKLRQTTLQDIKLGEDQPQIETFWDRNFPSEEEVPWYKFQKCFLDDYETQLSNLFDEENIPWLLDMLKIDVFEDAEKVTKEMFMQVRGDSEQRNAFWKVVSQIAVEKFNMKEVFNMNSSVRLTAIEKLAAFQNQAVVEALLKLLDDPDPNVRAVAAISLGRTGCKDDKVVDELIKLLKDNDRIVRQSACLSLGAMKAAKAAAHIGHIWRNDFISVVRNAARTALENMNIPEAREILSVTKILEEEIAALEGDHAAV